MTTDTSLYAQQDEEEGGHGSGGAAVDPEGTA
jgi:hypothetical protein